MRELHQIKTMGYGALYQMVLIIKNHLYDNKKITILGCSDSKRVIRMLADQGIIAKATKLENGFSFESK